MHRVYISYHFDDAWYCQFKETGLGPIGRTFKFSDEAMVRKLVEDGRGLPNSEARCMFDLGLQHGRGGLFLQLTDEQYAKLKAMSRAS